jgi:hypothetical protein
MAPEGAKGSALEGFQFSHQVGDVASLGGLEERFHAPGVAGGCGAEQAEHLGLVGVTSVRVGDGAAHEHVVLRREQGPERDATVLDGGLRCCRSCVGAVGGAGAGGGSGHGRAGFRREDGP